MRGGSLKRFKPDGTSHYRGASLMPAVGQTIKRVVKWKAQGLADRAVDRAASALAKKAKQGIADLLGV